MYKHVTYLEGIEWNERSEGTCLNSDSLFFYSELSTCETTIYINILHLAVA